MRKMGLLQNIHKIYSSIVLIKKSVYKKAIILCITIYLAEKNL